MKLRFPRPWGEARAYTGRYPAFDGHGNGDRGDQALKLASERGEASFQLFYGEVAVEGRSVLGWEGGLDSLLDPFPTGEK
ncbi:MAG TPA: hypothetical protein DCZ05_04865 [Deltaproteobacteria bacterium]|nr:hypothetical protein [Deltaproteobacteria bacterium]